MTSGARTATLHRRIVSRPVLPHMHSSRRVDCARRCAIPAQTGSGAWYPEWLQLTAFDPALSPSAASVASTMDIDGSRMESSSAAASLWCAIDCMVIGVDVNVMFFVMCVCVCVCVWCGLWTVATVAVAHVAAKESACAVVVSGGRWPCRRRVGFKWQRV